MADEPITEFTLDDLRTAAAECVMGDSLGRVEPTYKDNAMMDALLAGWLHELRTPINQIVFDLNRPKDDIIRWLYRKAVYDITLWREMEHPELEPVIDSMVMTGELIVTIKNNERQYQHVEARRGSGPVKYGNLVNAIGRKWKYSYLEARARLASDRRFLGVHL